jgi:hypothetical protein
MSKTTTIAGKTFLFTGKITEFKREDAEAHVEAQGGKVLSGVSAKLNYLVVGEDAGNKLAKAEALGTITILDEKVFLKMMKSSKKAPAKSITKSELNKTTELGRNEILLNCDYNKFLELLKKFEVKMEYENFDNKIPLIEVHEEEISFDDLDFELGAPVFYWSKANSKLIIHYTIEMPSEQINLNGDFFKELAKYTKSDFKIAIWDMESREMFYVLNKNGALNYDVVCEDDLYTDVRYVQNLAKSKGLKKKGGEYDSDEMYDVIYKLTDDFLSSSNNTYLEIAPTWFKNT